MPRPTARDRFLALSATERARWLDPAETEFCAQGFAGASLNRILDGAQESKGRTYHYFDTKGALFQATLERRLSALSDLDPCSALDGATDGAAYWARLGALNGALTQRFQQDDRLAALIRTLHQEPAAQQACAALLAALHTKVTQSLALGQTLGAVRTDLPLALMADVALSLLGSIDRWFAQNQATLAPEHETTLSQSAFSLLQAPFLPPIKGAPS